MYPNRYGNVSVMYLDTHTAQTRRPPARSVPANVAAELARQGLAKSALIPVLGVSRNTLYARFADGPPFDTDELELIAVFLGVPVTSFWRAAA